MRRRADCKVSIEEGKTMTLKSNSKGEPMKHLATMALMLSLGVAGAWAQPGPVNMTVSGTAANSTVALQPGTPASEYNLAGNGTLGSFTLRAVSASTASPQQSSSCSGATKVYFAAVAGAGVFRFADGGLLTGNLTGGGDCIDFAAGHAFCTRIFQITGGTGRYRNASGGTVTLGMTVTPVLADATNNPVFLTVTGGVTGTVSGVGVGQGSQDGQP
jgi:hypothetical protein